MKPGTPKPVTRKKERGFALLVVFLMAAVVGMYLYTQLPRVAFESERDKEQTLIDRGEQYKRAIQLYVTALKKYPQKIEDLENTNEKRYLRRRYIDPMTGKDEWRLIHVNAAGQLTDSLVQKPPCGGLNGGAPGTNGSTSPTGSSPSGSSATGSSAFGSSSNSSGSASSSAFSSNSSGFGTTGSATPGTGDCATSPSSGTSGTAVTSNGTNGAASGATPGTSPNNPNEVNAAVRVRPSDVVGQAYTQPSATNDPNDPSTWAPITLTPVNANGQANGQPPSGAVGFNGGLLGQTPNQGQNGQGGFNPVQTGFPGQPGASAAGAGFPLPGQPGFNPTQNQFKIDSNGQLVPFTPTQPQTQTPTQTNPTTMQPQTPPAPGQPFSIPSGTNTQAPVGGVLGQVNNAMMNPNPVAGQGLGTSAGMSAGGIAGVASNFKGPSIKIYGTRQKYQEWEFIFSQNNQQGGPNTNRNPLQPGQTGLNPQQGNGAAGTSQTGTGTTSTNPGSTTGN